MTAWYQNKEAFLTMIQHIAITESAVVAIILTISQKLKNKEFVIFLLYLFPDKT